MYYEIKTKPFFTDFTGPTDATDASGATDPTGATSTSPLAPDNMEFNVPQSNCFISNVRTFGDILQQINSTSEGACLDLCVSIERWVFSLSSTNYSNCLLQTHCYS